MRRKLLWVLPVLLVAALAGWAALRAARPRPEWTTDSPAALAELRLGLDAGRKYYRVEARDHLGKALALDPEFAGARLMLLRWVTDDAERKKLLAALAKVDRTRLNPREVFLVDYQLAAAAEDRQKANQLLHDYLAGHPEDPYALEMEADRLLYGPRDMVAAEKLYTRLIAIDPNWVTAQNNLGYLAMAQGKFALAEDRFRTYRYVAPDQPNPHDSLGEMMVLQGRWEEARRELEVALRIRPDFCDSYYNLVQIAVLTNDFPSGRAALDRAAATGQCKPEDLAFSTCRLELWEQLHRREYAALAAGYEASCTGKSLASPWVPQLAALLTGDLARARAIEAHVAKQVADLPAWASADRAVFGHLAALRLVAEGKPAEAARSFAQIDASIAYSARGVGIFKLYNRLQWANALELAGDPAAAAKLIGEVEAVNAPLAGFYRAGEIVVPKPLGAAVVAAAVPPTTPDPPSHPERSAVSESLTIDAGLSIPLAELGFETSRSSGPGGQNVNKVETRVTLTFPVTTSPSLDDRQRALLLERLRTRISKAGVLRVVAQRHRTQGANREEALLRFAQLLRGALAEEAPRRPSRPPAASRRRRLQGKRQRSDVKRLRASPSGED